MPHNDCKHDWAMCNVKNGYLVVEGCFHCGQRISFFSQEPVPPIDDYREGEHFWSFRAGYQATMFDLKCDKCMKLVALNDVAALMLCMRCDPECGVNKLYAKQKGRAPWVYVALCTNTSHPDGACVTDAGIRALEEYFNAGIREQGKEIIVAPCSLRVSPDMCQGIVLADVGLTELY